MNNEVFLLIAGWFFLNAVILACSEGYDAHKRIPLRDAPLRIWMYFIDCIAVDIALVAYALTQWGGA